MNEKNIGEIRIDPISGKNIVRDIRPFTVKYKNLSKTISLPGWYPEDNGDAIFSKEDLDLYDTTFDELKAEYEKKGLSTNLKRVAAGLL